MIRDPQSYNFGGVPTFDAMAQWGAPSGAGGGAGGTVDWNAQIETLLANGDVAGAAEVQGMLDTKGYNAETLSAVRNANTPPSKWATGAQTFGSVAQGLAGLGNIYLGLQGMKQQKKAFEFNKGVTNTNLNNSINDYNRRLNDTLTNRSLNNGGGQSYISDQLSKYSAKRS